MAQIETKSKIKFNKWENIELLFLQDMNLIITSMPSIDKCMQSMCTGICTKHGLSIRGIIVIPTFPQYIASVLVDGICIT